MPVGFYGFDNSTGAYQGFRKVALCGGDRGLAFQAVAGPEALEATVCSQTGILGTSSSSFDSVAVQPLAAA